MAITFISKDERLSVYVWEITEDISYLLKGAELTSNEIDRYDSFRAESRKRQWLAVRALVNKVLGRKVLIHYSKIGRPFIESQNDFLSISHSDKYAAIAIGKTTLLGVDIESITRNYSKVKHKFVSDEEAGIFISKGFDEQLYVPIVWCTKEAAFKAAACSEVDFLRDITIKKVEANDNFSVGEVDVAFNLIDATATFKFSTFNNHVIVWGDYGGI